jgi:glycosyltransferase involved in cell wall biosynthesis
VGADPDVSVVLPARDPDPRHFGIALRSTLRSRHVALDVVVVDHGSAAPLVVDDHRVTVVRVDRDAPFADALNTGLAVARHDLVARMDADDVMHPERLGAQSRALVADDGLAAVASRIKVIPRMTTRMRGHALWMNSVLDEAAHRRERFVDLPICHPALMFRRAALDDVGGYRDEVAEDYDLLLRLWSRGARVRKLPAVHLGWRQHDGQATRRIGRDVLAGLRARHLVEDYRLGERAVVVVGAGKEGRRMSRALRAEGVIVDAFVDVDPDKVGRLVHGAPVHPPAWLHQRPPGSFVMGAVGTSGARGAVRALLADVGVVEDVDGICVA